MTKRKTNLIAVILMLAAIASAHSQIQMNLRKSYADSLGGRICVNIGFTPENEVTRFNEFRNSATNGRSAFSGNKKGYGEIIFLGEDKFNGVPVLCRIFTPAENTDAPEYLAGKLNKTTNIYGVWGLWFCNYVKPEFKIDKADNDDTINRGCFFEISPLLSVDGTKSVYPEKGYNVNSCGIESALESYSCMKFTVLLNDSTLTFSTGITMCRHVHFTLEKIGEGNIRNDGTIAECNINDDTGMPVYKRMRMIFIKNSIPETEFNSLKEHDKLNVVAMPRISLFEILSRINRQDNLNEYKFDILPVEMVIISTYNN